MPVWERLSQALRAWQTFNWLFQPGPVTFDTNTQIPRYEWPKVTGLFMYRQLMSGDAEGVTERAGHGRPAGEWQPRELPLKCCAHAPRNQVQEHAPMVLMGRLASLPGL